MVSAEQKVLYDALKLSPGASAADVKRAYFRLIREHSPEKDPEGFQLIRRAYEALKDGPVQADTAPEFPMPDNAVTAYFLQQAEQWEARGEYQRAASCLVNALEVTPDDPLCLSRLANALIRTGNTQKAARYAERLTALCPQSAHAHSQLANATYSRGWYKKALPAFRTAYRLGCRELPFMTDYASCARDNDALQESLDVTWETLGNTEWADEELFMAVRLFYQAGELMTTQAHSASAFLDRYDAFLTRYHRQLKMSDYVIRPLETIADTGPGDILIITPEDAQRILRLADSCVRWKLAEPEDVRELRIVAMVDALQEDRRLASKHWQDLAKSGWFVKKDPKLSRYAALDAELCIMDDWETVSQDAALIRADYPELCAQHAEFFAMLGEEDVSADQRRLEREFLRLSDQYRGAEYTKRLQKRAEARMLYASDASGQPFVRSGEKVGRNDPCPCGSGKKFKKCCMGKGVYD